MPIKRAGPFATTTNPYEDAPETPELFGPVPVNCNKHQSTTWPWRAVVRENVDPAYISTGGINITAPELETEDQNGKISAITIQFAYQATKEWSFSGSSYAATATGDVIVLEPSVEISVAINGEGVFSDSDTATAVASISGNIDSVVFPASIVPSIVLISISAVSIVTLAGDGSATASISLPLAEN